MITCGSFFVKKRKVSDLGTTVAQLRFIAHGDKFSFDTPTQRAYGDIDAESAYRCVSKHGYCKQDLENCLNI